MHAADGEYLVVATVRRPHGIKGELYVALETDRPKAVFRAGRSLLLGDSEGRPVGGALTVERARPQKDGMLLKLAEHGGRTAELEALRGRSLLIPATEAAPAAAEEIHYRDLRGMEVYHAEEKVGTVRGVMETTSHFSTYQKEIKNHFLFLKTGRASRIFSRSGSLLFIN